MNARLTLKPTRRVFNPILADDPTIEADEPATAAFYTPTARKVSQWLAFIISGAAGLCLLGAWIITWTSGPAPIASLLVLLAFVTAGAPALSTVWQKLATLRVDIDLLMLLGAVLAAYIGSPFEGALLLFLFALSGALEKYALRRTHLAIDALRTLAPTSATLMEGGETKTVPLQQVALGARLLIRPGERIPLDGSVVVGQSSIDESAITGESIPRSCTLGDDVFAGTHNLDGRLEVCVTKLASDTTMARIVDLVVKAREHPARAERLIDRIGPTYSVIVITASLAVSVGLPMLFGLPVNESIRRGIALLIVASPCALIIATPVVYLSAIAGAAKRGVLVKGGAYLESLARAPAIAFDKTGTLTTGKISLESLEVEADLNKSDALRLVGSVEALSTHPLAIAVQNAASQQAGKAGQVSDYRSIPGEGASATVEGRRVWVGRPEALAQHVSNEKVEWAFARISPLREQGQTVSAFCIDDTVGLLAFRDTLREGAHSCIRRLRKSGVERVHLLTGDHDTVAQSVATALGLDGFLAQLSPEDKVKSVQRLQKHKTDPTVLVGDGINDAPALAHADIGIAMGGRGADIALDAADIVLMNDRIESVAWIHSHSQRTLRIVRQNIIGALTVITILSVLAVMGTIPLPLAVVGHEGSTITVALNGLRLLRTKES